MPAAAAVVQLQAEAVVLQICQAVQLVVMQYLMEAWELSTLVQQVEVAARVTDMEMAHKVVLE